MAFNTRRGRPSSQQERTDLGTPELIKKRLCDVTTEAIDICLHRNLITPDQHWCGIHLRWLYTLRYGVPSVKALDTTHLGGRELSSDHPEWRKEREREYHDALQTIGQAATIQAVLELCVFNQRPVFLKPLKRNSTLHHASRLAVRNEQDLRQLRTGLDALVKLWCKPISPRKDI